MKTINKISIAALLAAVSLVISVPASAATASAVVGKTSPVSPRKEQVQAIVKEAYEKFKGDTRGKNADYIPELGKVDSNLFGIAIVTTDNQTVSVGDTSTAFSIQSIAKVFSLALAMEEQGPDKVFEKVGAEPTGRAFNSPVAVVDMPTHTGNPLVNAGRHCHGQSDLRGHAGRKVEQDPGFLQPHGRGEARADRFGLQVGSRDQHRQ